MDTDLVVYDMDGTLADTSPGIISSFMYTAQALEVPEPSIETLYMNMGGSLIDNMARIYGVDHDSAIEAARIYREHYGREGYLQAKLFPGMEESLREIRRRGISLGVATMKLDEYAKKLVEHWGIADLFDDVCGADCFGVLSKSDLIDRCIYASGAEPSRTLMVGDSTNDLIGARDSGTRFVAVTFGYGFTPEICRSNGIDYVEIPGAVLEFL